MAHNAYSGPPTTNGVPNNGSHVTYRTNYLAEADLILHGNHTNQANNPVLRTTQVPGLSANGVPSEGAYQVINIFDGEVSFTLTRIAATCVST